MTKPRLRFVSVGGIAPKFGAAELIASLPGLVEAAEIEAGCVFRAPSPSLQPGQLAQLAERIEAASAVATLRSP